MKLFDLVENIINRFPNGYIFTYRDFSVDVEQNDTIRRYLGKLVAEGRIARGAKGKFYKPEHSPFGKLPISIYQLLKDLLEEDTRRVGYMTGYMAFNELRLTTQVPSSYQIAINKTKKPIQRGGYTISFILQKNTITKGNIPLLKILDCIKLIKKIPDTTIDQSVIRLQSILKDLNSEELKNITRLSLKYPPSTRAILGAMIENTYSEEEAFPLKKSLNGISKYKLKVSKFNLPNKLKWNII